MPVGRASRVYTYLGLSKMVVFGLARAGGDLAAGCMAAVTVWLYGCMAVWLLAVWLLAV
jgi:hypothetical protein